MLGLGMFEEANLVEYRTCTLDGLDGWDGLQVCYLHGKNGAKQLVGSILIARHPADGTILRNIDFHKWEKITDDEHLRGYQKCFDDSDKAASE
jgi:hypothetical protein